MLLLRGLKMQVRATETDNEVFGKCGCGRNPGGKCMGWHGLSEDEWTAQMNQLRHNAKAGFSETTYKIVGEDTGEV